MQDNLYFCIMLDCKHHIKMKPFVRRLLGAAVSVAVLYSCASVGRLEGGPIDEEPPRFVTGSPLPGALHNKKSKISIEFDEFIKLEKANEKVVISPPQVQQPEIKANGKRVVVNLQDTLKANTTYTIDFADAIQDNNEGNPMQGFTYTFSTGAELDSMAIAGTLLDASNLEPVKGVLVGLHANLADSAFTTLPFDRVGRTDSRGQFSIRGVSPGKYRIYALMDADQNFKFSQPTEVIAFNDSVIIPSMERRMRQDTLWRDSLTVDTIVERQYTHFLPDDVLLRSFKEKTFSQRLMKTERLTPEKFSFYFTAPADSLPLMKGLNFDEKDAFVIEQTTGRNARSGRMSSASRRVRARVHDHSQEAEFGYAKSSPCEIDQRERSERLHSGRRPQPAGALDRPRSRRPCEGPAGRPLSLGSRRDGCRRGGRSQAAPLEVRSQEAEGRRARQEVNATTTKTQQRLFEQ